MGPCSRPTVATQLGMQPPAAAEILVAVRRLWGSDFTTRCAGTRPQAAGYPRQRVAVQRATGRFPTSTKRLPKGQVSIVRALPALVGHWDASRSHNDQGQARGPA